MRYQRPWLAVMAAIVLLSVVTAPASAIKLEERAIFFEINDTDGDAGIQLFLDGEGWDHMTLENPGGDTIFEVTATGSIGMQGITEFFFESAEPSFEEQSLEELLMLFPEGEYSFEGTTTEGESLVGEATLTHVLPIGPVLVLPAEDDDSVDPDNTVIEWQLVDDPEGSEIVAYEVVVERDVGSLRVFTADMGPETTSVTVPPEFMEPGTAYKFEVLAIEASGNQTISERDFETEE